MCVTHRVQGLEDHNWTFWAFVASLLKVTRQTSPHIDLHQHPPLATGVTRFSFRIFHNLGLTHQTSSIPIPVDCERLFTPCLYETLSLLIENAPRSCCNLTWATVRDYLS
jgi:hypothetical protein